MDLKWPYTSSNRQTKSGERASINVNVSRTTEMPGIKRKEKCFETLWIIYLRKEIKVKDKRTTHSPPVAKIYFIFSSQQIRFFKPIRTWSHVMTNILFFCLSLAPQIKFQNRRKYLIKNSLRFVLSIKPIPPPQLYYLPRSEEESRDYKIFVEKPNSWLRKTHAWKYCLWRIMV